MSPGGEAGEEIYRFTAAIQVLEAEKEVHESPANEQIKLDAMAASKLKLQKEMEALRPEPPVDAQGVADTINTARVCMKREKRKMEEADDMGKRLACDSSRLEVRQLVVKTEHL